MYSVLFWKDHAVTPDKTFTVRENGDGTITLIPAGKIIQQGTNMSAFNFNNMEQGILAANITGIEALRLIGFLQTKTEALEGQIIEATLTNSRKYPFNDSGATLPLDDSNPRNNKDYTITVEAEAADGFVGEDIKKCLYQKIFNFSAPGRASPRNSWPSGWTSAASPSPNGRAEPAFRKWIPY